MAQMDIDHDPALPTMRLFGTLGIVRGGKPLVPPASRKTRAILGFLVLSGRHVGRQRLCDLFFDIPDDPRASLRWSLSKLRPLIDGDGAVRLIAERDALRFDPAGMFVDALAVQVLAMTPADSITREQCDAALDLMRGDLLEDCELPDRPEYTAWLEAQRQDFQAIAVRLANRLGELSTGEERIAALRRLVALDPFDEAAQAALARGLTEIGRRDEAHQAVAMAERHMRQAGLATGPALRMALRATPQPAVPAPPPPPPAAALPVTSDGRLSVAIVPLLNHSPDQIPDELMDGLLEASVHMLSKFRDFRVAGLTASLRFKGNIRDPAVIGQEMGVSHLIGGSVMVREGRLKIRYRIVASNDGGLLSSGDLDHDGIDAFAFLEDAPARLVVLLGHHLADIARRRALATPPGERSVHDHFLVGVHTGFFANPIDYVASLAAFEAALRIDPEHPPSNAYAAWAKAGLGHAMEEPGRSRALTQAHLAMARSEIDADSLSIAGWSAVHIAEDFEPALRAVELATRLNPLSRIAWSASAWVRAMAGEVEAPLRHWDNAERWNPLGSNIDTTHCGRAICLWMAGRFEESAQSAKRGLERQPSHPAGHMAAVASAAALGDKRRTHEAARAMVEHYPDAPDTPVMASIPIRDRDTRARLLDTLRRAADAVRGK